MLFWTVVILIGLLLIIDSITALRTYTKEKKHWKTVIHMVLLVVLGVILWNLTVKTFSLGLEIPFIFDVYRAI